MIQIKHILPLSTTVDILTNMLGVTIVAQRKTIIA